MLGVVRHLSCTDTASGNHSQTRVRRFLLAPRGSGSIPGSSNHSTLLHCYFINTLNLLTERGWLSRLSEALAAGRPGFYSRQGQKICLFSTVSKPVLGLTQPLIQWVPWALSPGVKQLGRETDHSPPLVPRLKW
jgi:hypothetical protein